MKQIYNFILTIVTAMILTSCATVINGPYQQVPISSNPLGADVCVDGYYIGVTPTVVCLQRKNPHIVSLSKQGFYEQNHYVDPCIGGAVFGNIIAGGLIGWGVDAYTGSQYNLCPEAISADLHCPDCSCL